MMGVDGCGSVCLDDPASDVIVTVTTEAQPGRHQRRITTITVTVRDGADTAITSGLLARLPLTELARYAAPTRHPNDVHWRTVADTKPVGTRSWPDTHWPAVAAVWRWAHDTSRPGGPNATVAEFWQVSNITTKRWLAHCRALGLLQSATTTPSNAAAATRES